MKTTEKQLSKTVILFYFENMVIKYLKYFNKN